MTDIREEVKEILNRWKDALEGRDLKIRWYIEYIQMGEQDDDSQVHLVQERLKEGECFQVCGVKPVT